MGLKIYIFGSGSAGQRYYHLAKKNGLEPYFLRDSDQSTIERESQLYSCLHWEQVERGNYVVIADQTYRRKANYDRVKLLAPEILLIEKPIYYNRDTRNSLDALVPEMQSIKTGDQYFFDDLLQKYGESETGRQIKIDYIDYIGNITKGNINSYAVSQDGGGAKWTLTHTLFVSLLFLTKKFAFINYDSISILQYRDEKKIAIYKFEYKGYEFLITVKFSEQPSDKIFQLVDNAGCLVDFNGRKIFKDGNFYYKSDFSRTDLIEKTFLTNSMSEMRDQFYLSYKTCQLLGSIS
ncbi:MAG: hypothetical protein VW948_05285 [Burkholderiaceae bacterium]